jgi:uncharacterized transporter YbjL
VRAAEVTFKPSVPPLVARNFEVLNTNLAVRRIADSPRLPSSGVLISRFWRGGVVTAGPSILVGLVARASAKLNYAELCGLLAVSIIDQPALALTFAQQTTRSDVRAVAYAAV